MAFDALNAALIPESYSRQIPAVARAQAYGRETLGPVFDTAVARRGGAADHAATPPLFTGSAPPLVNPLQVSIQVQATADHIGFRPDGPGEVADAYGRAARL